MDTLFPADLRERLYGPLEGSAFRFEFDEGVFIAFFHPDEASGKGGVFSPQKLSARRLVQIAQEARNPHASTSSSVEVKIIGAAAEVIRVKRFCQEAGFTVMAERAVPAGTRAEVLFYPAGNRVRVARTTSATRVRVMIVDDSPTVRKLLQKILSEDPNIEIVAEVGDPAQAEAAILTHRPDVITLDIHMPEEDGVTLLKRLLPKYRIPTVMITSISLQEGPLVLEALENGAVDYVQKPSMNEIAVVAPLLIEKIKSAAQSKVVIGGHKPARRLPTSVAESLDQSMLVAIGSSTGGTEALREILTQLPAQIPPIVIVQHIPPVFSRAFAIRLDGLCPFEVKEAEEGDEAKPGRVLIAPGGLHMKLKNKQGRFFVSIEDSPPVNRHRPSVDVLFDSIASMSPDVPRRTLGVILTGMGNDGAKGLLALKEGGARTIAQDESSCVVYGMPREAVKIGAACEVLPLSQIAQQLTRWLTKGKAA